MFIPQMNEPHIKFVMTGAIALCVAKGRSYFDVGLIKGDGPHGRLTNHELAMEVWEVSNGGRSQIRSYTHSNLAKEVFLDLSQSSRGIGSELFGGPAVDRFASATTADFAWTLDFENHEMHAGQVLINAHALRSVLRTREIAQAIFYTQGLSTERLVIADNSGERNFGQVATTIEALVALPANGATITNDKDVCPLERRTNVNYEVIISHLCPPGACAGHSLASIYDRLYDGNGPNGKIHLVRTDNFYSSLVDSFTDIQSGCPSGNFGESPSLPPPE